ncbi:MAG TPA: response regulator transcription factor [Candidatus Dormibacteraeota bacterium]|nr:response regulator transcription factor [Candidatus Dormibacteraeota bacterium]
MRILVVEDEPKMLQMLRDGLREHGHTVVTAEDGLDGLRLAGAVQFEVILLDVLLPKLDGWQVLRELKRNQNPASVLVLTACDGEADVIAGLDGGAADYLTKPFSFLELLARIRSLGRSRSVGSNNEMSVDTLVFDFERHQAFRSGERLNLTRTEIAILECLLKSAGETVTRAALINAVWHENSSISRSTLDSFINLLRKKVDSPGERKLLHTITGTGFSIGMGAEREVSIEGKRL